MAEETPKIVPGTQMVECFLPWGPRVGGFSFCRNRETGSWRLKDPTERRAALPVPHKTLDHSISEGQKRRFGCLGEMAPSSSFDRWGPFQPCS